MSTWLGPRNAPMFGQILFWVCLWVFLLRLTFQSVNWVKQFLSLRWMNFTGSTEGLNRIMRLMDPLSSKRDLSWRWTWTEVWALPGLKLAGLWTGTTPWGLWVLRPTDADWNCTVNSPGSLACWPPLQILGFVRLHNQMNQFLKYILLVLFLWRALIHY